MTRLDTTATAYHRSRATGSAVTTLETTEAISLSASSTGFDSVAQAVTLSSGNLSAPAAIFGNTVAQYVTYYINTFFAGFIDSSSSFEYRTSGSTLVSTTTPDVVGIDTLAGVVSKIEYAESDLSLIAVYVQIGPSGFKELYGSGFGVSSFGAPQRLSKASADTTFFRISEPNANGAFIITFIEGVFVRTSIYDPSSKIFQNATTDVYNGAAAAPLFADGVVFDDGKALVIFNAATVDSALYYRTYDATATPTWPNLVTIDTDSTQPSVTLTGGQTATISYAESNDQILVANYSTVSGIGTSSIVNQTAAPEYYISNNSTYTPTVSAADSNNIFVAFRNEFHSMIHVRRYDRTSAAWTTEASFGNGSGEINLITDVKIDPFGNAILLYGQFSGTPSVTHLYVSRFVNGGDSWTTPTLVDTSTEAVTTASIAFDTSGQALILYTQGPNGSIASYQVSLTP